LDKFKAVLLGDNFTIGKTLLRKALYGNELIDDHKGFAFRFEQAPHLLDKLHRHRAIGLKTLVKGWVTEYPIDLALQLLSTVI